jgi:acetolactate synthase-1/2/3 large subunit
MSVGPLLHSSGVSVPVAIVKALAQGGVRYAFGMAGGNAGRIFPALATTSEIRTVLVRSEAVATCAAEATARLTGSPAIAIGQGPWLVGQGIVGLLEAKMSGIPMILLSDLSDGAPYSKHVPYQSGTGDYGAWDARAAFASLTKETFVALNGIEAVQAVQLALKHATCGQPGPVAVLFHSQSLTGSLAGGLSDRDGPVLYETGAYLHASSALSEVDLSATLRVLREASRPTILAGGGVRSASAQQQLIQLSELLQARVVTTTNGKGTFPESHPLAAGVFGSYGSPTANSLISDADVILVLGSRLSATDTHQHDKRLIDPARQTIVQVDIEPLNLSSTIPASITLACDVKAALCRIISELKDSPTEPRGISPSTAETQANDSPLPGAALDPRTAILAMRQALPADALICMDAGENRLLMNRHFEVQAGGEVLQPAGGGGMGYAISAAIGARAVSATRTIVAVCGDGGFGMSLPALLTVVEENLPITVIVFNNQALSWVRSGQELRGEPLFKSALADFDFVALSKSLGFRATRVGTAAEIRSAVRGAIGDVTVPNCIVVDVARSERFVDLLETALAPVGRA